MGSKRSAYGMFFMVTVLLSSLSCTRNDGDIGLWFGMWQVTNIEIDGRPDEGYRGNVVLKFQNDVMENQAQDSHYVINNCFVRWHEADGKMFFEIPENEDGETQYGYVPELHLPWLRLIEMKIVNLSGKNARLDYVADSGEILSYYLKKLY